MTLNNQTNRISAVGSGAADQIVPFTFPILATSDLTVYKLVVSTGVQVTLDETTNYTVSISGDLGGSVETVTTIETTEEIHIVRTTPFTQQLDLEQGGSFNAENVEDGFDKTTKLTIQNKDQIDNKTLRFPATDAVGLITILPSSVDRASKNLTFDSAGNVTTSASVAEGSVSHTTFGTNMAEAANALAGKAVINLDHVFDVRDYGTVGDGVTDDSAAIQAAINAATIANGVVFFPMPATSYFIASALVPKSNTTMRGVEGSKILFTGINSIDSSAAITNWTCEKLIFDGQLGASKGIVLDQATSTFITVKDCEFQNMGTTAVTGRAMEIEASNNVWINNNNVHDCFGGIVVTNCNKVFITNNVVKDMGPGSGSGQNCILVWANAADPGDSSIEMVTIANNLCETGTDNGIRLTSQGFVDPGTTAGSINYVTVTGNVVKDMGVDCFRLDASNMSVTGNVAINPGNGGFRANSCSNTVIADNIALTTSARTSNITAGINIGLSQSASVASNNSITGNTIIGDQWENGIWCFGNQPTSTTGQGLLVSDNTLIDTGTDTPGDARAGITINRYNDVTITGNRLDNTFEGISLATANDNIVSVNHIVNCTGGAGRGIRTALVTNSEVSGNVIFNVIQKYDLDTDSRLVVTMSSADVGRVTYDSDLVSYDDQIVTYV